MLPNLRFPHIMPSIEIWVPIHQIRSQLRLRRERFQSTFASASRRDGVKLFARRTLGDTILVLRPESFFRATMTGAEDLVTR